MADLAVITLQDYIHDHLLPPKHFVLTFNTSQVRNLLAETALTACPPGPTAGIVIRPVPGLADCFLGHPICLGGGELEFVELGWNCKEPGKGEPRVNCGATFRFVDTRDNMGALACSGSCEPGQCKQIMCLHGNGLMVCCACR